MNRKTQNCIKARTRVQYTLLAQMLVVMLAVWLIYSVSVQLPFYSDDVYHFQWIEARQPTELLLPSASFASYRPLPSLVWYLWRQTVGFYSPAGFHALNVLLHIANAWLTMALARRISRGTTAHTWFPGIAGLLFALYPFAYQAVLWVGALTHLLGAFLLLLAVLFYDIGRRRARRWLLLSWGLAMLSPLSNEAGLLAPGLIALYEWSAPHLRSRRRLSLALVYLPVALVQPVIWLNGASDSSSSLQRLTQPLRLLQKAAYFAQGATFPFQFASGNLVSRWNWEGWWAVSLGIALAVLTLVLVYPRACWREGVLASAWVALTVLPPLVALSVDYVGTAPRLLYTAAVGISILWARVIVTLFSSLSGQRWRHIFHLAALLLVLGPAVVFIRQRVTLYRLGARPMSQALDVSRSAQEPLLFVNTPAWIAYKTLTFPLGREGVSLMPSYVSMADFIWANTGRSVQARAVAFANIRSSQPYWYSAWQQEQNWDSLAQAIRASKTAYVCLWQEWDIQLVEAGGAASPPSTQHRHPIAVFENGITLWKADVIPERGGVHLALTWSADQTQVSDTVFVHLVDDAAQLAGQMDGFPLAGMYPFWLWQAGEQMRDVRWIPSLGGLLPGGYEISLGLYDPATGERKGVVDAQGNPLLDNVVLLPRFVWPNE